MATSIVPAMILRPDPRYMTISAARHKNSNEDDAFTCQFPLLNIELSYADSFNRLKSMLEARLRVSLKDMFVVWCLVESGQLTVLNDFDSLRVAILDHQNAGKHNIHLYVVNKFGKIRTKTKSGSSHD